MPAFSELSRPTIRLTSTNEDKAENGLLRTGRLTASQREFIRRRSNEFRANIQPQPSVVRLCRRQLLLVAASGAVFFAMMPWSHASVWLRIIAWLLVIAFLGKSLLIMGVSGLIAVGMWRTKVEAFNPLTEKQRTESRGFGGKLVLWFEPRAMEQQWRNAVGYLVICCFAGQLAWGGHLVAAMAMLIIWSIQISMILITRYFARLIVLKVAGWPAQIA